jgi:alpha-glucosidase (family GH31 glycosyl hydrolase)
MKRTGKTYIAALFFLIALNINSQPVSTARSGNNILISASDETLGLEFCSSTMFRIRRSPDKSFHENETWMVRKYHFPSVEMKTDDQPDAFYIETSGLNIRADKNSLLIEVKDKTGKVLYSELPAQRFFADSVKNTVALGADEHFFGFGERMDFLDQRGKQIYLNVELGRGVKPAVGGKDILRANYCPIPLAISTRGYGIFFHTAFPTYWDMGWSSNENYTVSALTKNAGAETSELDYYFIYGPDMYRIIDDYTQLTGKSPMLPRYAMGLHVGTYSGGTWKFESETNDRYPVELARRLRAAGIPFDLIWLDSTWRFFNTTFGNGGCTFEWRETFSDPEKMVKDLYAEHVKAVGLHIRSILDNGPKYRILDRAKEAGNILVPHARSEGLVNFFDSAAVNWWWKNGAEKVTDLGVSFFKTDVGSAFAVQPGIEELFGHKPAELHNLFPLAYAEAPYRKFQETTGLRGLTHTREGYAGIQRYPYIWAGDWGSEWQWFEPLVTAGMNMGLSGVGNWTHCMGGFEQYSPYDTELYIRWCQFGMFSPIAMVFGMDHPRYHEPWTYGEAALDNFRKYARLRYTLLPYIYTAEHDLYTSARPIMTPLVMDYPQDENTYRLTRQYLFGRDMMICPVTTKGALSQTVYFPGGEWIDYETGERISGRQYKSFLTSLEVLPIYIRAGAIIPMQAPMQWVGQYPENLLTLDVYPAETSFRELYEDDGETMNYEKGIFALTRFKSELTSGAWTFTADKPKGPFIPPAHTYLIKVLLDKKPATVSENGKMLTELDSLTEVQETIGWFYEDASHRLWVKTKGGNNENRIIKAQFHL